MRGTKSGEATGEKQKGVVATIAGEEESVSSEVEAEAEAVATRGSSSRVKLEKSMGVSPLPVTESERNRGSLRLADAVRVSLPIM